MVWRSARPHDCREAGGRATQEAKAEGGRSNIGCRVGESILGTRTSQNLYPEVATRLSTRMTMRIEQGKGRKDRYAVLSPVLLERLRQ